MDADRAEHLALEPVRPELDAIDAAGDPAALWSLFGALMREGVASPAIAYVYTDKRAADEYITYVYQGGLRLPDRAYYREEQYATIREQYVAHIERMLALAGRPDPAAEAATVMELETRLAASHWDRVATATRSRPTPR